jgi:capsular polysaccharide transport system permease protein
MSKVETPSPEEPVASPEHPLMHHEELAHEVALSVAEVHVGETPMVEVSPTAVEAPAAEDPMVEGQPMVEHPTLPEPPSEPEPPLPKEYPPTPEIPKQDPSAVAKVFHSEPQHDSEKEESRFLLIKLVVTPFQHLIQTLSGHRSSDATVPAQSITVHETSLAPHVTRLELKHAGGAEPPQQRRIPWSFLIMVVLPTLLAMGYYGFLASDQYESTADFVIKTQTGGDTSSGLAGILGAVGMGGGHGDSLASGDASMVQAYVDSDQILRDLSQEVDLRAMYCSRDIDWVSRLKTTPDFFQKISGRKTRRTTSREISDEDLLSYWRKKVTVADGHAPGTSTLKVLAFTPEDAKVIADHVITLGERLVNHVSERAMKDAVVFAQKEVNLAHDRAMKAFDDLQEFQSRAKQVDPQGYAKARNEIQGKLEGQLSSMQAQMEALRQNLPDEAPGIQQMRTQISALQEQLLVEKNQSTSGRDGRSAAEVINEFGKRQLETEFASKDYLSALTALESARINANRQNRYLEPFNLPNLPDKPALPRRLYSIITVLAVCLLLWGGWTLFIAGVKEHQY